MSREGKSPLLYTAGDIADAAQEHGFLGPEVDTGNGQKKAIGAWTGRDIASKLHLGPRSR